MNKDLVDALMIFEKYRRNQDEPRTCCAFGLMLIIGVEKDVVSTDDVARLRRLGFGWSDEHKKWVSHRFGDAKP